MMYPSSKDSFIIVKNVLLQSFPIDISIKKHQEEQVLLVLNSKFALFFLNEVASKFLYLCNGKKTVNEIIYKLLEEYDTDYESLADDIVLLIRDLQMKRIIFVEI